MNANMLEDESGATDNRITWNPSDYPQTQEWEDGKTYTVTVKLRQTAPGEGMVLSINGGSETESEDMNEAPETEQEAMGGEETPLAAEASVKNSYSNPAVAGLMRRRKV